MENDKITRLFRYNGYAHGWDGSAKIYLIEYEVIGETPKGYWVDNTTGKKWVSKSAKKRLAYPTKEEALTNLIARKRKHLSILRGQEAAARDILAVALELEKKTNRMTAKEIAKQVGADFYGAPHINEDYENWLVEKIEAYADAKKLEAWKEVNDAWAGGYLNFGYISSRIEDFTPQCQGCMCPCGNCKKD